MNKPYSNHCLGVTDISKLYVYDAGSNNAEICSVTGNWKEQSLQRLFESKKIFEKGKSTSEDIKTNQISFRRKEWNWPQIDLKF